MASLVLLQPHSFENIKILENILKKNNIFGRKYNICAPLNLSELPREFLRIMNFSTNLIDAQDYQEQQEKSYQNEEELLNAKSSFIFDQASKDAFHIFIEDNPIIKYFSLNFLKIRSACNENDIGALYTLLDNQ